jgi:hypothetical protein
MDEQRYRDRHGIATPRRPFDMSISHGAARVHSSGSFLRTERRPS